MFGVSSSVVSLLVLFKHLSLIYLILGERHFAVKSNLPPTCISLAVSSSYTLEALKGGPKSLIIMVEKEVSSVKSSGIEGL